MTVTYTHQVANARLGGFTRLLRRWRGSVYKLIYKEFLIYISVYYIISFVYRFGLTSYPDSRLFFEKLCLQFNHYTDLVPVSFVLGFYVTIVVGRWWSQFENVPWPDRSMMLIGSCVHGADERGKMLRRTLMRYLNLGQVITYRSVSTAVMKRFPTLDHVVKSGLMTENEKERFDSIQSDQLKYWVPFMWFSTLAAKIRQEGRIYDDMTYNLILNEMNSFRGCCGWLTNFDWISVPLVYTQVVTVAVYMFFMSTLLSRQYLMPTPIMDDNGTWTGEDQPYPGHEVDIYVPIFTIGQFFFYMGWLKVAEQLINPFGEDDDDFEANTCIDRNYEVSMIAVDELYAQHPKLEKDKYWNNSNLSIPYTKAAVNHKNEPWLGSTFDMRVDKSDFQLSRDRNQPINDPHLQNNNNNLTKDEKDKMPSGLLEHLMSMKYDGMLLKPSHLLPQRLRRDTDATFNMTATPEPTDDEETERVNTSDDDDEQDQYSVSPHGSDVDENNNDPEMARVSNSALNHDETNKSVSKLVTNEEKGKTPDLKVDLPEKQPPPRGKVGVPNKNRKSPKRRQHPDMTSQLRMENNDTDRENAQKRMLLTKRQRNAVSLRRMRSQQKGFNTRGGRFDDSYRQSPQQESYNTPGDTSSIMDSPFGSILSVGTSIPSPKPLRWAYNRSPARSMSIASSMHSPTTGTDISTPLLFQQHAVEMNSTRPGSTMRSNSIDSTTKDKLPMPYRNNMRKRLQVVNSNTPSPLVGASGPRRMVSVDDDSPPLVVNEQHQSSTNQQKPIPVINTTETSIPKPPPPPPPPVKKATGIQKKFKESAVYLEKKFMRNKTVSQDSKHLLNESENSSKSPEPQQQTKVRSFTANNNNQVAVNSRDEDVSFRQTTGSGFWRSFNPWKAKKRTTETKKTTPRHKAIPLQTSASFADSFDSYSSDVQWTFRFNEYDSYYDESEGFPPNDSEPGFPPNDESQQSLFVDDDRPPSYSAIRDDDSNQADVEKPAAVKPEEERLIQLSPEPEMNSNQQAALIWENEVDQSKQQTADDDPQSSCNEVPRPSCLDVQLMFNTPDKKTAEDNVESNTSSDDEEIVEEKNNNPPQQQKMVLIQINDASPEQDDVITDENQPTVTDPKETETLEISTSTTRHPLSKSLSFDPAYFTTDSLFVHDDDATITCPSGVEHFDNSALFQCKDGRYQQQDNNNTETNNNMPISSSEGGGFTFEAISKSATTVDFSLDTIPENKRI